MGAFGSVIFAGKGVDAAPQVDDVGVAKGNRHWIGHTTCIAKNGEKGIKLSQETKLEIIILDAKLSGIDGIEFCRQARELAPEKCIYFLILTSLKNKAHRELAINTEVDIYSGFHNYQEQ